MRTAITSKVPLVTTKPIPPLPVPFIQPPRAGYSVINVRGRRRFSGGRSQSRLAHPLRHVLDRFDNRFG